MAVQEKSMKYSRKDLLQLANHHLNFDEEIEFDDETYKQFPRIRKLTRSTPITPRGTSRVRREQELSRRKQISKNTVTNPQKIWGVPKQSWS